jgi:hypothetical protein
MRKSASLSFAALAVAAVVAGAGCSASGTTATPGGTPTPMPLPTVTCTPPPGESIQMVFPKNGATGQANLQGVVFAVAPSPLPTNWYIYVTHPNPNGGAALSTLGTAQIGFLATPAPAPSAVPSPGSTASAAPTATPLPTPSDAVTIPGTPIFETASVGTFATSTTFTVYLADTTCSPGIQQSTFTTADTNLPSPTPAPTATPTP